MRQVSLRQFQERDIDFAYKMTLTEKWNTKRNDVARMFDFEPRGCFIAEVDGKPAGHVFSISYGPLGWIGLLIVSSDCRRMGVGTILMKRAVDYLLGEHVETIELDAVPEIADLYRRLGFVDEYDSLRFKGTNEDVRASRNSSARQVKQKTIPDIIEFDARYFGARRARVLSRLFTENPELSFASYSGPNVVGYITCRRAEAGYNLGPWVCDPDCQKTAEELFLTCMEQVELHMRVYVGLPSPNKSAIELLTKHGFCHYSESVRMRLGKEPAENTGGIFAIGGPMKG